MDRHGFVSPLMPQISKCPPELYLNLKYMTGSNFFFMSRIIVEMGRESRSRVAQLADMNYYGAIVDSLGQWNFTDGAGLEDTCPGQILKR